MGGILGVVEIGEGRKYNLRVRGESGEVGFVLGYGRRGGFKYVQRKGEDILDRIVRFVLKKMYAVGNE